MQSIKQIGAILLLSLLFVKAMVVPAIFVNYELRKDFIIQNYCVNKDMPELECDGQCYLAKQLKAAQQEDEKNATNTFLSKVFEIEFSFTESVFSFRSLVNDFNEKVAFNYTAQNTSEYHFDIFHPPRA
ncbi:hypothetical protein [Jiulongibacter sp. NS-SX5]|uniref:hypothetical protein n=1 Tax=Jiulongibacter sp. NS-SX5 TaxID=3463854 RepID=UPI004058391F